MTSGSGHQSTLLLGHPTVSPEQLINVAHAPGAAFEVLPSAWDAVRQSRVWVEESIAGGQRVYGINTGFGFLAEVAIDDAQLKELQLRLIRSHACGVGDALPVAHVRAMMLIKAHGLLLGHSGVTEECIRSLLGLIEKDVTPVVPCQGSVGASGDLAPLAHVALAMIGEGEVWFRGKRSATSKVFQELGMKPYKPQAKEGLSLINGTQLTSALGAAVFVEAQRLASAADVASALSLDAIRGTLRAADPRIHAARGQIGQMLVARQILSLFDGEDAILNSHEDCGKVQDPYSFRCVPQVHGASRDVIAYVGEILTREVNGATDNPLVFGAGEVLSGGNFHAQPIAIAMDFLAIGLAELGSISERRIEKLTNPHMSGLPAFLTGESGLNSGFMIPHVVAAALVSENKVLCHPASVDSIPTSADKEDHVSMGPIAARKAQKVAEHLSRIIAIELMAACQGLDLLRPLKPAPALQTISSMVRKRSPELKDDRVLSGEIEEVAAWLRSGAFHVECKQAGIRLH